MDTNGKQLDAQDIRPCPSCGSLKTETLKNGTFLCNSCGYDDEWNETNPRSFYDVDGIDE